MSKDQVRRAIHVKRFSSAHEPQVGLSSLSSKNHKSSSVDFVSNSQRVRDKELELLAVLANTSFFSFLLSVWRNQNYCLKPKKNAQQIYFPMWTIAAFAILVHFIVIFYSTFIFLFFYSGLRNRKEKERLGGELTEGEGQKKRAAVSGGKMPQTQTHSTFNCL